MNQKNEKEKNKKNEKEKNKKKEKKKNKKEKKKRKKKGKKGKKNIILKKHYGINMKFYIKDIKLKQIVLIIQQKYLIKY